MRWNDDLNYFESPEFKEVLAKYESSKENHTAIYMDADELTDVAEYYAMVCHDDERADEVIDLALQLHPDAVDPQVFRARKRMLDGDISTAELICDAIEDQQNREVIFLRAELQIRQERYDEALAYLLDEAEAIEEDVDYFLFDSAYIFIDYYAFSQAGQLSEKLEKIAPKWFKTWQLRADVLLAQEKYEDAITYIEHMLDVDPFYIEAWNWRCEAYCGLMEYDKALESCEYALAVEPQDERAMELKAWTLMQQGNVQQAHELYQQLERINPNNELHYYYDSICMFHPFTLDVAQELVEKAEELSQGMSTEQQGILEHHAHILSERECVDAAIKILDQAEEQFGLTRDQTDYDFLRARVYSENGRLEPALDLLKKCISKYSSDLCFVYFQCGEILYDGSFYEQAKSYFLKVPITPFNEPAETEKPDCITEEQLRANTYGYLAACHLYLKDYEQSFDYLHKAVELHATNLQDLFRLWVPEGTHEEDYADYIYYKIYGTWPPESLDKDIPPF